MEAKMNELDRQTAYWDSVAAEKVFTHPLDTERFRALTNPESVILDYGCGYRTIALHKPEQRGSQSLAGALSAYAREKPFPTWREMADAGAKCHTPA
jgi:hypothetical protein